MFDLLVTIEKKKKCDQENVKMDAVEMRLTNILTKRNKMRGKTPTNRKLFDSEPTKAEFGLGTPSNYTPKNKFDDFAQLEKAYQLQEQTVHAVNQLNVKLDVLIAISNAQVEQNKELLKVVRSFASALNKKTAH